MVFFAENFSKLKLKLFFSDFFAKNKSTNAAKLLLQIFTAGYYQTWNQSGKTGHFIVLRKITGNHKTM
jgi:hypothetical protein